MSASSLNAPPRQAAAPGGSSSSKFNLQLLEGLKENASTPEGQRRKAHFCNRRTVHLGGGVPRVFPKGPRCGLSLRHLTGTQVSPCCS